MHNHILVPLDGSALAETALPHAVALARATGAALRLLRVIEPPVVVEPLTWSTNPLLISRRNDAEEARLTPTYLANVADLLRPTGVEVQTEVLEGDPATRIVDRAAWFASTTHITMATHGRSGLSHLRYGSVAEKVLHGSPIPVLLIHAGSQMSTRADESYRSILVPLDGSPFAEQALSQAVPLATAMGATIVLVSVVGGAPNVIADSTDTSLINADLEPFWIVDRRAEEIQRMTRYLQCMHQRLATDGIKVRTEITYGDPAEAVPTMISEQSIDLVIMATHGRTGLRRIMLGSVARDLVRRTDRPVLLVRPTVAWTPDTNRDSARPDAYIATALRLPGGTH